jgi:hypothetical protein
MPAFLVGGRILANMAGFKAHATFGFWRGGGAVREGAKRDAMGQFGRLESISDLPPAAELGGLIRKERRGGGGHALLRLPRRGKRIARHSNSPRP